jgi:hypothetical protein
VADDSKSGLAVMVVFLNAFYPAVFQGDTG